MGVIDPEILGPFLPGALLAIGLALLAALGLLAWRLWPVVAGAARPDDDLGRRLHKWNRYVVPLLRRRLRVPLEVVPAAVFTSGETGRAHGIAAWALTPALVPDVEFVALARPRAPDEAADAAPDVRAVGEAKTLRALLGDAVRPQVLWGHAAFLYVWPEEVDLDAVARHLLPVETFGERHGVDVRALLQATPGTVAKGTS